VTPDHVLFLNTRAPGPVRGSGEEAQPRRSRPGAVTTRVGGGWGRPVAGPAQEGQTTNRAEDLQGVSAGETRNRWGRGAEQQAGRKG
jgi:hypothetical protein